MLGFAHPLISVSHPSWLSRLLRTGATSAALRRLHSGIINAGLCPRGLLHLATHMLPEAAVAGQLTKIAVLVLLCGQLKS